MSRYRVLVTLECAAAVLAMLVAGDARGLATSFAQNWGFMLAIIVATATLTGFGVWLPRGDAVDNSAALAFLAACYLSPLLAAPSLAAGWVLGVLASRRDIDVWQLLDRISRRSLLVVGTFVATVALSQSLAGGAPLASALGPSFPLASRDPLYWGVGGLGVLFVSLDLTLEQLTSSSRLSNPANTLLMGVLRLRGWMVAAEMSVAVLAVFVYPTMDLWSVLMATGMLLLMRQSFALLLDMRASYDATIEVVARSLGEADERRRGQAKRVANMVAEAARRIGIQSTQLEDVRYAALFHDVSRIGADDEDDETERTSSEVLSDVKLLAGALPILQLLDGVEPSTSPDEHVVIGAYLIARFSGIDAVHSQGKAPDSVLEDTVGARLYASTRKSVDKVIRQVEQTAYVAQGVGAVTEVRP